MADVVVIGGGISGVAAAYELASAAQEVVLVERFGPAAMASGWTLAGVRQSGRHPAELPLASAAVALWGELDTMLEAETGYRRRGNLRLARDPGEVEVIRRLVADHQRAGLGIEFLPDNAAVRTVAPALSERVLAASYCPSDGHADPVATVQAYARAAERRGARLRIGERATAIEVRHGQVCALITDRGRIATERVVVAAGVLSNELLRPHGLEVSLTVPMVTVVRTEPLPPLLEQVLGVASGNCAGRQEISGRLRVTGGSQPWHGVMHDGPPPRVAPTAASLGGVLERVGAILPALREARIESVWAGLIDLTPDGLPVIEASPEVEGLVIAAGFSGHGFCLGPITGRLVAELVQGRPPCLGLDAFRRSRFADLHGEAELTLHG